MKERTLEIIKKINSEKQKALRQNIASEQKAKLDQEKSMQQLHNYVKDIALEHPIGTIFLRSIHAKQLEIKKKINASNETLALQRKKNKALKVWEKRYDYLEGRVRAEKAAQEKAIEQKTIDELNLIKVGRKLL